MNYDQTQSELHFHLAADGTDPVLRCIVPVEFGKPLDQANLNGIQGAKTIRAFCIGLLWAKHRSLQPALGSSWSELAHGAPRKTWAATLVENIGEDKNPSWLQRVRAALGADDHWPYRLCEAHGKFNVSYSVEAGTRAGFWPIKRVRLFMGEVELGDERLRNVAITWERSEKSWEPILSTVENEHALEVHSPVSAANSSPQLEERFKFLIGDLETSHYRSEQIDYRFLAADFLPSPEISGWLESERARIQQVQAQLGKTQIWYRPLARLHHFRAEHDRMLLTLENTNYLDFAATNIGLMHNTAFSRQILKCAGNRLFDIPSPYLANPLNTIGMVISSDGYTFVAYRSESNFQRAHTWQPSVGGAVETTDLLSNNGHRGVFDALKRETWEELGLAINSDEVEFLALGTNCHSGEPDLVALIRSPQTKKEILEGYERNTVPARREYRLPECWRVDDPDKFCHDFFFWSPAGREVPREWASPTDRAIIMLSLIRTVGRPAVEESLQKLGHSLADIYLNY